MEDFSPSKFHQSYEQPCSTDLHQTIYTSRLYQPAASANSPQKKRKSVFFSRSSRTVCTCRVLTRCHTEFGSIHSAHPVNSEDS